MFYKQVVTWATKDPQSCGILKNSGLEHFTDSLVTCITAWLWSEIVQIQDWPTCSPDMSQIENATLECANRNL